MYKFSEDQMKLTINRPQEVDLWDSDFGAELAWRHIFRASADRIEVLHTYIASAGNTIVDGLVDELICAADRGVSVIVHLDKYTYVKNMKNSALWYTRPVEKLASYRNISVKLDDNRKLNGGVLHAKLVLSDGCWLWLGSNNFDWRAFDHIFEVGVIIRSNQMANLVNIFVAEDQIISSKNYKQQNRNGIEIEFNGAPQKVRLTVSPSSNAISRAFDCWYLLKQMLNKATQEILVSSRKIDELSRILDAPDWNELSRCLLSASSRGVQIKVIVDKHQLNSHSGVEFLRKLKQEGGANYRIVSVPAHSSGDIPYARMYHAKFIIVDGNKAWLGSNNFTQDDFLRAKNFGLMVEGEQFSAKLRNMFFSIWSSEYCSDQSS